MGAQFDSRDMLCQQHGCPKLQSLGRSEKEGASVWSRKRLLDFGSAGREFAGSGRAD